MEESPEDGRSVVLNLEYKRKCKENTCRLSGASRACRSVHFSFPYLFPFISIVLRHSVVSLSRASLENLKNIPTVHHRNGMEIFQYGERGSTGSNVLKCYHTLKSKRFHSFPERHGINVDTRKEHAEYF